MDHLKLKGCLFAIGLSLVGSVQANQVKEREGFLSALQATVKYHPSISGKRAEVMAKYYQAESARSLYYPDVSVSSGYRLDDDKKTDTLNDQIATLTVSQPLWDFGKTSAEIDYAEQDEAVEKSDLSRVTQALLEQTALTYANIEGIQKRKARVLQNIEEYNHLIEQIQRRQRSGVATKSDLSLASSRLLQAENKLYRLEGDLRVAKETLLKFTQVRVQVESDLPRKLLVAPSQLVSMPLRSKNPDLEIKQHRITLAQKQLQRQERAIYPALSLQLERDLRRENPNKVDENRLSVVFTGALSQLGFSSLNNKKVAAQSLQAAKYDLATSENDVKRRGETLLKQLENQQRLAGLVNQSVDDLGLTLDSYYRLYKAGRKSWLDVLNIQRELNEQKLQQIEVDNQWLLYRIELASLYGELQSLIDGK